ncbi:MAG: hypothetical protein UV17_C0051G0015 [Candidatus Gottesmanbacteria bacterium GW2011_GWA1_42_26]|nr:MAG: hypothetical protein UV17_C0051G0015 [Candidatus Gottesmanbacteria bacterium GW2011_GWA1_42_26]
MLEKIGEKVSVNLVYNHSTGVVIPKQLRWKNQIYQIQKIGLHYTLYQGNTLIHMFSVCDQNHYFLLSLDTKTLHWTLEQVADTN